PPRPGDRVPQGLGFCRGLCAFAVYHDTIEPSANQGGHMPYTPEYTDYDAAVAAFNAAMQDVEADNPEAVPDDYAADICASVATLCDAETARELCRTELGFVPRDVLRFFPGMKDVEMF